MAGSLVAPFLTSPQIPGSVAAATLAQGGHSVLVLEKGKYYHARDLRNTEEQSFDEMYERGATLVTEDTGMAV